MGTKKTKEIQEAAASAPEATSVIIQSPKRDGIALEITGTAALIQNKFSQKAIEQMLKKHMGITVQKEKKVPREVVEQATIRNVAGKVCVPPQGIKAAMITASTQLKSYKKTQLRTALFVDGQSVPVSYREMIPRMDMVRTSGIARVPDVRFRPSFHGWSAKLFILYSDMLSPQSVMDLLQRAGTVGLGEWRPEKNGVFGTFEVSRVINDLKEIAEIRKDCASPIQQPRIPEWAMDAAIDPSLLAELFGQEAETPPAEETEELEEAPKNGTTPTVRA